MNQEFAKIIHSSQGQPCLFYVEPDGNDDYILHQIVNETSSGAQIDLCIRFKNDTSKPVSAFETSHSLLEKITCEYADRLIESLEVLINEPN